MQFRDFFNMHFENLDIYPNDDVASLCDKGLLKNSVVTFIQIIVSLQKT